jgi:DNA polymerase/3'-5' exonuclease PolX
MEATMNESLHLESARDELPQGAIELLQLRGLGPKRVQVLRGVGVQCLVDLRAAAQEQRLRCVPGFSAALEQNILSAVMAHLESRARLAEAGAVAREKVHASRRAANDGTARRFDAQAHAANMSSPTGWMRSIWRSAAA